MWTVNDREVNVFFVRKIVIVSAVIFFTFTLNSVCIGEVKMNKYSKNPELREKYIPVVLEFIKESRGWDEGEYRLEFDGVIIDKHVAIFRANHIDDILATEIQIREENFKGYREYPNELVILIDTETMKPHEDRPGVPTPWSPDYAEKPETMTAPPP